MDKRILRQKRFFFLTVTFFFYLLMLFFFINVSSIMYNNTAIYLAIKEMKNIKKIIELEIDSENKLNFVNLNKYLSKIDFYPQTIYIKIYDINNTDVPVYQIGRDVLLENTLKFKDINNEIIYNKTTIKDSKQLVYEVYFGIQSKFLVNILFDISGLDAFLFKERRGVFFIVFFMNLFILIFLSIMIINLQNRLYINELELSSLNKFDKLTGLLIKEAFFEELRIEIERIEENGGILTLITADIDNMIGINENFGYDFGDHIIKNISSIIKENIKKFDYGCRFGGDEFVILTIGANEKEGIELALKLKLLISEMKFFYEGKEVPVTLSFGVASSENIGKNIVNKEERIRVVYRNLLFNSMNALSRAKRSGKNKIVGFSELSNNQINMV